MDFKVISGVGASVVIGAGPEPDNTGAAIVIGERAIIRDAGVSVIEFAGSGSAGACAAGADCCEADNGAPAPTADGIRAAAKLGADNEINPLTTNEMTNKKVAIAVAKRKTGTDARRRWFDASHLRSQGEVARCASRGELTEQAAAGA